MKHRIKENINNPKELERLYRSNKKDFAKEFFRIFTEVSDNNIAEFWKIRLEYDKVDESERKLNKNGIFSLILACIISGVLIKVRQLFSLNIPDYIFYQRNAGLVVFFGLSLFYFLSENIFTIKHIIISLSAFLMAAVYINLLPLNNDSYSVNLAYIHLPLFIWCVYGLIFIRFNTNDLMKRIDYIKYNGDLVVLSTIILIAGSILIFITLAMFHAIDINVENFYMNYITVWGLVFTPIVATYIIRNFPFVTNKIAPVIANIFSPIVLITLVIYLISIPVAGKDPYNDREFLLIFNLMLFGVMAIIVFSVSETSINKKQRFNEIVLCLLAFVTLLIDMLALSAIVYRLGEYGFTPNRTAVLGSNLLIFVNLVLILKDLIQVIFKNKSISYVEYTVSKYLPVYAIWTIIVVFGFPVLFGFK
jgi:hypothetical protein